jgi:hypothetical protein
LFGRVFGHDASTWNFGKSSAKAGTADSAQANTNGTIFMSPSPAPVKTGTGISLMLRFQPTAIKG